MFCCLIWNVSNYAILISHHHVVCYISHWLLPLLYSHCAVHQLLILIIKIWHQRKQQHCKSFTRQILTHVSSNFISFLLVLQVFYITTKAQNCGCWPDLCCSQFGFCGNTSDYCVVGCQQGP
ncbi:unnamed protein product [Brassica rapa subsp. narinosa]